MRLLLLVIACFSIFTASAILGFNYKKNPTLTKKAKGKALMNLHKFTLDWAFDARMPKEEKPNRIHDILFYTFEDPDDPAQKIIYMHTYTKENKEVVPLGLFAKYKQSESILQLPQKDFDNIITLMREEGTKDG